jgi:gluconate kinase
MTEAPLVDAPRVVLIVGVPGAGKTTVARELARRFERSACIEGDLVQHHFTVSGLVGPGGSPAEEAERQLRLRWTNCAQLARNFWAAGFTAVVEHAASRRYWIEQFLAETAPAPLSLIVLAPDAATTVRRDGERSTKQVAHLFAHMDAELRQDLAGVGWWLDTSAMTVEETVDAVLAVGLHEGSLR